MWHFFLLWMPCCGERAIVDSGVMPVFKIRKRKREDHPRPLYCFRKAKTSRNLHWMHISLGRTVLCGHSLL
jgi:hypothetical protein